ncbi:hypothetical protein ACFPER_12600 [Agromyces aurantiacus]|uniref:Hemagglutinin n=1 Tax=Agromyces aurantiacus TaxID=165814 RepID=A0ABV9R668_9MICO|nr:hypothetical protein [Agromyces aurantiacus]MBM7504322.1 hypothetical protein [Agromyces aurantiacus]
MGTTARTWMAALAAFAALAVTACSGPADFERGDASPGDRRIPSTDRFDPGFIVSDDAFYDAAAMTETEIQEFLGSRECRPVDDVPCLDEYVEDVPDVPAVGPRHCDAVEGGRDLPASRIIAEVADACGISPRTFLVLLQKEQSLLTRPSARGYERATGYGCPDTADCDAQYFGFFNQVYRAGWQFRQYTAEPDRRFQVGRIDVPFNPEAACGATTVRIRNQATANLYNYTPYQPNAAVLADPSGGDDCSAYGNLNFWRLWHRWFGDPQDERLPAYFPPCSRLVGGYPCPPAAPPVPDGPASAALPAS